MSGLSANVSSCGGEGDRGGLGGDAGGSGCLTFLGFGAAFVDLAMAFKHIGANLILSSSLEGADDNADERDELSSKSMVAVLLRRERYALRKESASSCWGTRRI